MHVAPSSLVEALSLQHSLGFLSPAEKVLLDTVLQDGVIDGANPPRRFLLVLNRPSEDALARLGLAMGRVHPKTAF